MNNYLQTAYAAIEHAITGMTDEQMQFHPPDNNEKWCSCKILEHLSLAFGSTANLMQRCLDSGAPSARKPTVRDRLITMLVVRCNYIPEGRKAPKHTVPSGIDPHQARRTVFTNLKTMDQIMQNCEERFGGSIKIANHPALGPLTLDEWRKFHLLHTRHHMKQIARLRAWTHAAQQIAVKVAN